ncbi:MAG TPA: hypothetical protein VGN26_17505 [Armatimonadota bacterium]|jgi:hypothetical protein
MAHDRLVGPSCQQQFPRTNQDAMANTNGVGAQEAETPAAETSDGHADDRSGKQEAQRAG